MATWKVKRIKLGSQGLEVSAQGLGCMGLSSYGASNPETDAIALLHHAINSGVTFLDTSDVYGPETNELLLAKALKDGMREKVELATKFGIIFAEGKREIKGDPAYVRAACEASLKRLDVACVDLYYQHRIDTLAWVHHQGDDVCPIPGTTKIKNLNENIAALSVKLTPRDMTELEAIAQPGFVKGERYGSNIPTFNNSETPPLSSWKAA